MNQRKSLLISRVSNNTIFYNKLSLKVNPNVNSLNTRVQIIEGLGKSLCVGYWSFSEI